MHIQNGILQTGAIHLYRLLVQVDTFARYVQPLETAFHQGGFHKIAGIELGIVDFQLINDHLFVEQWQQLDIDNHPFHIGYRVGLLNHLEVVNLQVQGESQLHMPYADVHACFLRGDSCNLIHCPVLYRRQIKQNCQYHKQQNRAKQYTQNPPEGFLHISLLAKYAAKIAQNE